MGIGGLDREFNAIFRRAFASRVFPPEVVEQLGKYTKHLKYYFLIVMIRSECDLLRSLCHYCNQICIYGQSEFDNHLLPLKTNRMEVPYVHYTTRKDFYRLLLINFVF